jgi:hypothetical protein
MSPSRKKPKPFAHTTVIQSRVPLFLPLLRLPARLRGADIEIETSWGRIKIKKCRLTQVHRDLLDAIFISTREPTWLTDGALLLVFDLRDVQRLIGTSHNHTWVIELLDDMIRTVVVIDDKRRRWVPHKGLVREHSYTRDSAPRRPGQKQARLYAVTLAPEFARLWREDLLVFAPSLVPRVLMLRHAVCRALARMILTHREASVGLDDALRHVAALRDGMSERGARRVKAKVLSEAEALAALGIRIGGDRIVRYHQAKGVWFKAPSTQATPSTPAAPPESNDRPFERDALARARRGEIPAATKIIEKIKTMEARAKQGDT